MPRLRPTPTEIRTLSGRDEEVVSSLARHQFLTFSQVHRLHFPDRSATPARRCLWRLADRGLAGNVFEWTRTGGRPPGTPRPRARWPRASASPGPDAAAGPSTSGSASSPTPCR